MTANVCASLLAALKFAFPGWRGVIVHIPTRERCTREPLTVRWPNVMSPSGSNPIACPVFAMVNVRDIEGAALKLTSPGCDAVTVQEPAPAMCTVTPLTVQLPVAPNVTSRADEANAPTLKFGSPNVAFLIASNWMIDWPALWAVTEPTSGGAAAYVASPAWSYRTMHVPVPLVIVTLPPAFVDEPLAENVTGNPDVLSAATMNAELYETVAQRVSLDDDRLRRRPCGGGRRHRERTDDADARATCQRAYRDAAREKISRSLRIFVAAPS
jgi:hypothetical protein